jgi:hypothetical protein
MSTITTLPWAGTPATATDTEPEIDTALWLDGKTVEAYIREFGHGPQAAARIYGGLKAISETITWHRKRVSGSALAQIDVHPDMIWQPMRTHWLEMPTCGAHVINLETLRHILEGPIRDDDPNLLELLRQHKPAQLCSEAIILLERFALRVRDKQS